MLYAFGATGNATRFFFNELEETIIDSPISIETEHLCRILTGYSLADQGEPVIYSHLEEVLLHRGLDKLELTQLL